MVTRRAAADFLLNLIKAVSYKVHTVLTDNGTHFAGPAGESWRSADIKAMIERKQPFWAHAFEVAGARNDVDHRLTKPKHLWTNGQVERKNRAIKEATVKRLHYETHDGLRSHLADFVSAYNFARRLKTLKGLTPYEFICKAWTKEPERFTFNPLHQMPGLNHLDPYKAQACRPPCQHSTAGKEAPAYPEPKFRLRHLNDAVGEPRACALGCGPVAC